MLDAEALKESNSAHVIPSFGGMGRVLCSNAADSDSEPTEAEVGLKGTQVEDGGASHCPFDDGGTSYCALVDPGGAHQNLNYPSYDLDQLESIVPPISNTDLRNCGLADHPNHIKDQVASAMIIADQMLTGQQSPPDPSTRNQNCISDSTSIETTQHLPAPTQTRSGHAAANSITAQPMEQIPEPFYKVDLSAIPLESRRATIPEPMGLKLMLAP
ncbi:hypothetical protein Nepgr_024750 [Nepenthes gracilis]|uniref:Uncharacterized protein n=1 Tax=Nepenthes gracilis TaxID=150966 RepID=A0AAD3T6I3_NEPGR|nr:hypothetical protein Nepgr_024750 [Nepenthes gracilis]